MLLIFSFPCCKNDLGMFLPRMPVHNHCTTNPYKNVSAGNAGEEGTSGNSEPDLSTAIRNAPQRDTKSAERSNFLRTCPIEQAQYRTQKSVLLIFLFSILEWIFNIPNRDADTSLLYYFYLIHCKIPLCGGLHFHLFVFVLFTPPG